jgi:hormone-sensitive lipase
MICGTKYLLNPELRAKKIAKLIMNADIDFCKEFWRLIHTPVANKVVKVGSKLVTPAVDVNIVKSISFAESLYLPKVVIKKNKHKELVEVKPPIGSNPSDSVNIRVLSYEMLKGMVSEFSE